MTSLGVYAVLHGPLFGIDDATILRFKEQADLDEAARVAYVSATRAQYPLVVCAPGDTEFQDGWPQPLYDALYPSKDRRHRPEMASGDETVLNAPAQPQEEQIHPGVHRPKTGALRFFGLTQWRSS
ncbi:MAG TPA: hypothetical protein VKU19_26185 [Bryobacteraceae bacterium]|nr:hypothetical protein [Bryobacteraceae bacterium]